MNHSENLRAVSTRLNRSVLGSNLGIAALSAVVAIAAFSSPSEAEAGTRRYFRARNGQVIWLRSTSSPSSFASKVALNPQPLPPKELSVPLNRVGLNPQPLPPKELRSPMMKFSLNPQPLPPKDKPLIRLPGFGR